MKTKWLLCLLLAMPASWSQTTIKAAFLGNSYTYFNDLPNLIDGLANANGDDLIHGQNTPGGYTLEGHSTNSTSLNLLSADTWDFVVLQDQSQRPSFPHSQVIVDVYPKAKTLSDSIRSANACAVPVFFNTWGRLNGDPQWDSINTFERMNQRLYLAYNHMANVNSGIVSPVGLGFKAVYDDNSTIVTHADLYNADGSHPSILGSYLAACIFYNTLFSANSVGNSYLPAGLTQAQANYLQQIAANVMFMGSSPIFDYTYPIAAFNFNVTDNQVTFTNQSTHAFDYSWNFGDNNSSTDENPVHTYNQIGTYNVKLTSSYCSRSSTYEQTISINTLQVHEFSNDIKLYPNPVEKVMIVEGSGIDAIEIINIEGKILYQNKTTKNISTIDLSNWNSGVYFVKLSSDQGSVVKKIIKK